jgi:hypothetical protein
MLLIESPTLKIESPTLKIESLCLAAPVSKGGLLPAILIVEGYSDLIIKMSLLRSMDYQAVGSPLVFTGKSRSIKDGCLNGKNKENGMPAKIVEIHNTNPIINSKTIEREIIYHEKRIKILKELGDSFPGEAVDWLGGISLIRDDFFLEHAKAKAAEVFDMNVWPLQYINWEEAAEALMARYIPIDFEGVTYWVKKPI